MDKSLELEMNLMTARRKAEVKNACVHMENKKQFGSTKKGKILKRIYACEVCGNFNEFFIHEALKICKVCSEKMSTVKDQFYIKEESRMKCMLKSAYEKSKIRFNELVEIFYKGDKT